MQTVEVYVYRPRPSAQTKVDRSQAFLGCIFSAWSADKYGRKRTIQIGCVLIIIGGALNAGSVSLSMFGVGRAVSGVGSGILAIVVPMYQGEVATAETRGAMMCVTGKYTPCELSDMSADVVPK